MAFQSPFDQPSYKPRPKKKAKNKVAKKKTVRKVAKKKTVRKVAKKVTKKRASKKKVTKKTVRKKVTKKKTVRKKTVRKKRASKKVAKKTTRHSQYAPQIPRGLGGKKRKKADDRRMFPQPGGGGMLGGLFGLGRDQEFFNKPCLPITKNVPHSKAVTGSQDLDEIFDRMNKLFFKGRMRTGQIRWARRAGRGGTKAWAHNNITEGEIVCSTDLLRGFVPKGFLEHIVYHEMLHQVCPPKHGDGHHAEFLKAELLFPKGAHYVELNKRLSKELYEERHPVASLEEAGAQHGLHERHRNFIFQGTPYKIIGIQPSVRSYKVLAKNLSTGEETKFKPVSVKRAVDGVEAAYRPFAEGAKKHGLDPKKDSFTRGRTRYKVIGYDPSRRRYKFVTQDEHGRILIMDQHQLASFIAKTKSNPQPYAPDYLYEGVRENPRENQLPYAPDYLYEGVAE